ncbi:hypothetical protein FAM22279_02006 [Lacticaseibacillus paracasei]|uniref:hypothetical protein n=1 Tax=Lacticaseibacillus paracasei TaxID=1597 RepID=UPI000FEE9B06|nr:hypothetical protein [Lacticaseibacillus paracasei]RNE07222.1 hypothetical protein FAM22279_02006 [Lacticaseibacillus paracasei]
MADITHGTWIKDGKAVDAVYQNGVKVYGRNLALNTSIPISVKGTSVTWQPIKEIKLSKNPAGLTVTYSYDVTIDRPDSGSLRMQFGPDFSPAWDMPISADFENLQPGVKTNFHNTIVFPKYIGAGNLNDHMPIYLYNSNALVKFEDFSVVIGDRSLPYSVAPEDIM